MMQRKNRLHFICSAYGTVPSRIKLQVFQERPTEPAFREMSFEFTTKNAELTLSEVEAAVFFLFC